MFVKKIIISCRQTWSEAINCNHCRSLTTNHKNTFDKEIIFWGDLIFVFQPNLHWNHVFCWFWKRGQNRKLAELRQKKKTFGADQTSRTEVFLQICVCICICIWICICICKPCSMIMIILDIMRLHPFMMDIHVHILRPWGIFVPEHNIHSNHHHHHYCHHHNHHRHHHHHHHHHYNFHRDNLDLSICLEVRGEMNQ